MFFVWEYLRAFRVRMRTLLHTSLKTFALYQARETDRIEQFLWNKSKIFTLKYIQINWGSKYSMYVMFEYKTQIVTKFTTEHTANCFGFISTWKFYFYFIKTVRSDPSLAWYKAKVFNEVWRLWEDANNCFLSENIWELFESEWEHCSTLH